MKDEATGGRSQCSVKRRREIPRHGLGVDVDGVANDGRATTVGRLEELVDLAAHTTGGGDQHEGK